jgi:hypothetical protein
MANNSTTPGIIEAVVTAMTNPISVCKSNSTFMAMLMGLPLVVVKIRANTTSTQENKKQKKAVTAMPEQICGKMNVQITRGRV